MSRPSAAVSDDVREDGPVYRECPECGFREWATPSLVAILGPFECDNCGWAEVTQ